MKSFLVLTCVVVCLVGGAVAQQPQQRKTIAALTEKTQRVDGFVPLYINHEEGKIFLEVPRFDKEMLYLVSLPTGVGSNPIGLDRAQLGTTKLVKFERSGNKVLLVQPNYDYRSTGNERQRKSVEESFARSVIWGFKIEAAEGDRVLVDRSEEHTSELQSLAYLVCRLLLEKKKKKKKKQKKKKKKKKKQKRSQKKKNKKKQYN